ncbi:site-specific integrase [Promicromonospora alba]|uniref:Site-specific integrase n=1 Tax=Promicromonospora alba TaxID=1616110 RepID=A0ABV9HKL0_9MICO
MTTSLTRVPTQPGQRFSLPGITAADAARVVAAIAAERAPSTLILYASAWRMFTKWCATRGLVAFPADPATVCAYLAERAEQGLSIGTINVACAAIGYEHQRAGLPDPITDAMVGRVRRGLRRIVGVAPRRQARPLVGEEVRQIVARIDPGTAAGARDRALILIGFASALRRSELAALTLADVEFRLGGVVLTVRRSKADQDGEGQIVAVAAGEHTSTDPVAALRTWIAARGTRPGRVFTRMRYPDHTTTDPIGGHTVARIIRTRAEAAGIPGERVTGHSLRAGHATTAALAGAPLDRIAAQTRHRDVSTLVEHYIRPIDALANTSSRALGL